MEFSHMIIKNIKHNMKNYTAYLLGNTIIQCILFMFFTLIFSEAFINSETTVGIKQNLSSVIAMMVAFSMIFIIYTTVTFTKYRGKEFGVYFTIGLTSKEVMRILFYENIITVASSFLLAIVTGTVFSKLFHMGINKVVDLEGLDIGVSLNAYLMLIVISVGIFLFTTVYQLRFLKKYSVIDILKSKAKRGIGSTNIIIGIIGVMLLITSLILFNKGVNTMANWNSSGSGIVMISISLLLISLYLLIGFSMTVIARILKCFKGTYNRNILFINSLTHRFKDYRGVLYVVTLMVIGAMIFIPMVYSNFKDTENAAEKFNPNDISFVITADEYKSVNVVEKLKGILGDNVQGINVIESVVVPNIVIKDGKCRWFNFEIEVIGESGYKKITGKDLHLKDDEIRLFSAQALGPFKDVGVMLDFTNKGMKEMEESVDSFTDVRNDDEYKIYEENKRSVTNESVMNFISNYDYSRGDLLVVNDEIYNSIKNKVDSNAITYDVLVDLKNTKDYKAYTNKVEALINEEFSEKTIGSLTVKESLLSRLIKENSFDLFSFSFLGFMLLVGSAAVIYFKVESTIEEDRERRKQLIKLGLTEKEIGILSIKELAAIFLVPPVIAIGIASYGLSRFLNQIPNGAELFSYCIVVFIIYVIVQVIFYILTTKKYIRSLR